MADPTREEAAMPYHPEEQPASAIEGVLRRHGHALLARPGITGVAVGKAPTGDPAIVIYLSHANFRAAVPDRLDGYPVVVQVTGPIVAQPR